MFYDNSTKYEKPGPQSLPNTFTHIDTPNDFYIDDDVAMEDLGKS